ncbi:MAG: hypothetical protein ACLPLZ_07825 [Terracidiphilus sp.]
MQTKNQTITPKDDKTVTMKDPTGGSWWKVSAPLGEPKSKQKKNRKPKTAPRKVASKR